MKMKAFCLILFLALPALASVTQDAPRSAIDDEDHEVTLLLLQASDDGGVKVTLRHRVGADTIVTCKAVANKKLQTVTTNADNPGETTRVLCNSLKIDLRGVHRADAKKR
jgi:hypothetical protein